jgi:hypothetical protein
MTKGGGRLMQCALLPRPGSGTGGVDRWWGRWLTLGARAAANNDRRPWKREMDGHGGGIYYGGEVRWGSELGV